MSYVYLRFYSNARESTLGTPLEHNHFHDVGHKKIFFFFGKYYSYISLFTFFHIAVGSKICNNERIEWLYVGVSLIIFF